MFCTKCGSTVAETGAFCGTCGQPVVGPPGASATPSFQAPPVAPPQAMQPYTAAPGAPPMQPYGIVALPSPFAGFWLRLVAALIDSILVLAGLGVIALVVFAFVGLGFFRSIFENPEGDDGFFVAAFMGTIFMVWLLMLVGAWLYNATMESSIHQGTLGKMALGLIVTDLQGRRVTFGRASGRHFSKLITGLIPLALGYIMAGFTEKKQALHDMIASCLVLRKN